MTDGGGAEIDLSPEQYCPDSSPDSLSAKQTPAGLLTGGGLFPMVPGDCFLAYIAMLLFQVSR